LPAERNQPAIFKMNMTDPVILETMKFGRPDYEPVEGYCELCGEEIDIDPEFGDVRFCASCNVKGCKHCLLFDPEEHEYFYDTTGPEDCKKPEPERLLLSECRQQWLEDNPDEER